MVDRLANTWNTIRTPIVLINFIFIRVLVVVVVVVGDGTIACMEIRIQETFKQFL